MILQAYDFYQLFKNKNCILQIGGSDQWGNIVNGTDLIRRIMQKEAFGLTSPLITLVLNQNGKDWKRSYMVKWRISFSIRLLAILEKYWWPRC